MKNADYNSTVLKSEVREFDNTLIKLGSFSFKGNTYYEVWEGSYLHGSDIVLLTDAEKLYNHCVNSDCSDHN